MEKAKHNEKIRHTRFVSTGLSGNQGSPQTRSPEITQSKPRRDNISQICEFRTAMTPSRSQNTIHTFQTLKPQNKTQAETWQCHRSHISLKATIDVPLLGLVIELNGDGMEEDSLTPVG
jgi:hypothetical protein